MNSEWPLVTLGAVCSRMTVGHVGPMVGEYVDEGIPFLRSQNVQPFRVDVEGVKYISDEFNRRLKKSALNPGDVVVVRTGYPGTAAVIPHQLPVANCADLVVITPGPSIDAFFLSALFNSAWGLSAVHGRLVGSAQQHFNVAAARSLQVHLPPLPTQRKIAAILSAYDELIENNSLRIKLLEEMAERIYREWFVHFRYPGHEDSSLLESEVGPHPQGWRVAPYTDVADVLSGGTPSTAEPGYWGGAIPFFTPKDAPTSVVVLETEKHLTDKGLSHCHSPLYPAGTVFVTARGTVGKVRMAGVPMAMNQSCYALRGRNEMPQEFVLHSLLAQVGYLRTNTGGATFDTIIVDTFHRMRIAVPPVPLVRAFTDTVRPMLAASAALSQTRGLLRSARDVLLPRLISGEIDVEGLSIEIRGAAA